MAKCIDKSLTEIERLQERVAGWADTAERVEEAAEEIGGEVSAGYGNGAVNGILWMFGDLFDSESARPAVTGTALKKAAAFLLKNGFKKNGEPSDYPEIKRRSYTYSQEGCPNVTIMAFFGTSGASCRFVEIGKKEEPLYELQCDGEAVTL